MKVTPLIPFGLGINKILVCSFDEFFQNKVILKNKLKRQNLSQEGLTFNTIQLRL